MKKKWHFMLLCMTLIIAVMHVPESIAWGRHGTPIQEEWRDIDRFIASVKRGWESRQSIESKIKLYNKRASSPMMMGGRRDRHLMSRNAEAAQQLQQILDQKATEEVIAQ